MTTDSSEAILNDVYDLLCERLPLVPVDDPGRRPLANMIPNLARDLERQLPPRLVAARPLRTVIDNDKGGDA